MSADKGTHADHVLSDGSHVRVWAHGGLDVRLDDGEWHSVVSSPEACADIARLAQRAADGAAKEPA